MTRKGDRKKKQRTEGELTSRKDKHKAYKQDRNNENGDCNKFEQGIAYLSSLGSLLEIS